MCSSKLKLVQPTEVNVTASPSTTIVSDINGRPVLQPAISNRVLAKYLPKKNLPPPSLHTTTTPNAKTKSNPPSSPKPKSPRPPISPKLKSPRPPGIKRDNNNQSDSKNSTPPPKLTTSKHVIQVKKSKKNIGFNGGNSSNPNSLVVKYSSEAIVDAPGSIAAARREQVAVMQVQRKMKIAHYGRSKFAKYDSCNKLLSYLESSSLINITSNINNVIEEKTCSFITPNSDPIYVKYHDEEWGVPVHYDMMLFELLVLTGAQVGSDWTSVLKKRQQFREAFSGFEPEIVSKFSDIKITTMSKSYGITVGFIKSVVDNSNSILEIKKAFGSFDKYLWGFVNHKPLETNYKVNHKMPVKTSKSEAISKDMVRRGFRQVGPTVIHSFMQAAGLTNDHLTTCPRHQQCVTLGSPHSKGNMIDIHH